MSRIHLKRPQRQVHEQEQCSISAARAQATVPLCLAFIASESCQQTHPPPDHHVECGVHVDFTEQSLSLQKSVQVLRHYAVLNVDC